MRIVLVGYWWILIPLFASCSSGSSGVTPPDIDPAAAAEAAISQYDQNGDESLSAAEIESSAFSLERWDADRNGTISQEELVKRLEQYAQHGTAMSRLYCVVRRNNRPLADAKVAFHPEEFLGDGILPASGTTGSDGGTVISVAEEFRPTTADGRKLEALQVGLYQVEITHPEVPIREVSPNAFEVTPFEEYPTPIFEVRH